MNPNLLRAVVNSKKNKNYLSFFFSKWSDNAIRRKSNINIKDFFFNIIAKRNLDFIIEVGAHEASASIRASKIGVSAIAIEANPHTYQIKTIKSEKFGVKTLNIGIGKKPSSQKFFIPKKNNLAGNATLQKKENEEYNTVEIKVDSLNNLILKNKLIEKRICLWIDVEGHSRDVLEGANKILEKNNCELIMIEVESYPYFKNGALATEINQILESFNYTAVLADNEYKQQFNVVYIKNKYLDVNSYEIYKAWANQDKIKYNLKDLLRDIYYKYLHKIKSD